jgi:hypothetical protein
VVAACAGVGETVTDDDVNTKSLAMQWRGATLVGEKTFHYQISSERKGWRKCASLFAKLQLL